MSYFVHHDGFVRHSVWVWDAISLAVAYDRILHTQHVKKGGQFEPDSAGQFAPVFSGQFKSVSGGQYHRIFQQEKETNVFIGYVDDEYLKGLEEQLKTKTFSEILKEAIISGT